MYHVVATGITTTILYLISLFLYRTGFYSKLIHRKIWNSILAVAFLIAATLGLFLALQANYKWDLRFIKPLLKWHVETGTGLAFTGIIHLIWHFSYFTSFFKPADTIRAIREESSAEIPDLRLKLFMTGLLSSSFQLVMIREIMNVMGGYELVTGIFLGSWLIISSLGSALAGRAGSINIRKTFTLFSISPLLSVSLLMLLTTLFRQTGQTPSFFSSVILTLLILFPFCLISGFTFIKLTMAALIKGTLPGRAFAIETTGGIIAGILVPLLASGFMNNYQIILLIIIGSLFISLWSKTLRPWLKWSGTVVVIMLLVAVFAGKPDNIFRNILLPSVKVISSEDTPYGNITTGTYKNEKSLFYNQRLVSYNNDITESEENTHYALLQRPLNKSVILISGSATSCIKEILKYKPACIAYVESDPALAEQQFTTPDSLSGIVKIIHSDAMSYIRSDDQKANTILLLAPPPSTLALNRFYTIDFFRSIHRRLASGGVFLCAPGPADTYLSKEAERYLSSIYNNLSSVFRYVIPVAGNKLYLIASDEPLSAEFCRLAGDRGIETQYVNDSYLADDLIKTRSQEITSRFDHSVTQNTNSFPVAFFYFQSYGLKMNPGKTIPAILVLITILIIPLLSIRRTNLPMYFTASALAGFETITLFTLQVVAGNMYKVTGLLIACVMAGLAIGSGFRIPFSDRHGFRTMGAIIILFYLFTALIFNYLVRMESMITAEAIIILLIFIPSVITGQIFRDQASACPEKGSVASAYAADLAGSAFGFIAMAGLAIPLLGIRSSLFLIAALVLLPIMLPDRK